MDNHTAEGHQYDRQFLADPNILRQQMGLHAMHQSQLGLSGHQMSPQMFSTVAARQQQSGGNDGREHCVGLPSSQRSNVVQTASTMTPNPGTNSSPWMLSFTPQNTMDPEIPMMMSGLYQTRWSHQQNAVPATQTSLPNPHPIHQRDPRFLQSQFELAVQQRESQIRDAHIQQQQDHGVQAQRERDALVQRERAVQMHREQMQREQQEAQLQREKENQLQKILLQREQFRKHEAQMQRERDLQMQREREAQLLREKEAQLQREKEAQLQREREAQIQREREAQLQREREAQLQREREAQMQREREAQLQREREAQLKREHEAKLQKEREAQAKREKEVQIQKEKEELIKREREEALKREKEAKLKQEKEAQILQRNAQIEMDRKAQIRHNLMMQHENQFFQLNQPGHMNIRQMGNLPMMHPHLNFQNQHDVNSLIKKSMPTSSMNNHPFYSTQMKNAAVSSGVLTLNKQQLPAGSSMIHFPQSSPVNTNNMPNEQWQLSQNMANILKKGSNTIDDNFLNTLDPNFRDRNVFNAQFQNNQMMKNIDDIDLTIDRHISPIKIDCQDSKESEKTNTFSSSLYQSFQSQSSSGVTQMQESLVKVTSATVSQEVAPQTTFSQQNAWNQQQQQQPNTCGSTNSNNTPNFAFSHSNSVKVTQSSSVNINININMPGHHGFPFQLPELTTYVNDALKVNSVNEKKKDNNIAVDNDKQVEVAQQQVSSVSLNQEVALQHQQNIVTQHNIPSPSLNPPVSAPQQQVATVSVAQEVSVSQQHNMSSLLFDAKGGCQPVMKSSEYKTSSEVSRVLPFSSETNMVEETSESAVSKMPSPLNRSLSDDISMIMESDVPPTSVQMESKQKQSFSSIECFLGMNTTAVDSKLKFLSPASSTSSLEIARSVLEQQDRISVIKPLNEEKLEPVKPIEEKMTTNDDQMDRLPESDEDMLLDDDELMGKQLQSLVEEKDSHDDDSAEFDNFEDKQSKDLWNSEMQEIKSNAAQYESDMDHEDIMQEKVVSLDEFENIHKGYQADLFESTARKTDELQKSTDFDNQLLSLQQNSSVSQLVGMHGKTLETTQRVDKYGNHVITNDNKEPFRNLDEKEDAFHFQNQDRKVTGDDRFPPRISEVDNSDQLIKSVDKEQFPSLHDKSTSSEESGNLADDGKNTETFELVQGGIINPRQENVYRKNLVANLEENLQENIFNDQMRDEREDLDYSDVQITNKDEIMNTGSNQILPKEQDMESFEYERSSGNIEPSSKLKISGAPVHPSMRFKSTSVTSSKVKKVETDNSDVGLMHPSMRLRRNSLKSPSSVHEDDLQTKKVEPLPQSKLLQKQQQFQKQQLPLQDQQMQDQQTLSPLQPQEQPQKLPQPYSQHQQLSVHQQHERLFLQPQHEPIQKDVYPECTLKDKLEEKQKDMSKIQPLKDIPQKYSQKDVDQEQLPKKVYQEESQKDVYFETPFKGISQNKSKINAFQEQPCKDIHQDHPATQQMLQKQQPPMPQKFRKDRYVDEKIRSPDLSETRNVQQPDHSKYKQPEISKQPEKLTQPSPRKDAGHHPDDYSRPNIQFQKHLQQQQHKPRLQKAHFGEFSPQQRKSTSVEEKEYMTTQQLLKQQQKQQKQQHLHVAENTKQMQQIPDRNQFATQSSRQSLMAPQKDKSPQQVPKQVQQHSRPQQSHELSKRPQNEDQKHTKRQGQSNEQPQHPHRQLPLKHQQSEMKHADNQKRQPQLQKTSKSPGSGILETKCDAISNEEPTTPERVSKTERPNNIPTSTSKGHKIINIANSKPINHPAPGGKPASYNASLSEHAKPIPSGKPLAYLQSIADANKAEALAKQMPSGTTARKKRDISMAKTSVKKPRGRPVRPLNETPEVPEIDDDHSISSPVEKDVKNRPMSVQYNRDRKDPANQVSASNSGKQNTKIVPTNERAFTFNKITFDGKEKKETSESETDSSSESDDEEKQGSGEEYSSKTESGSDDEEENDNDDEEEENEEEEEEEEEDDDDDIAQGSGVSKSAHSDPIESRDSEGPTSKRKDMGDSAEVIANLKKRKFVDEELIKIPLKSGWQRQTRLRPSTNSGEGLRGDVYYYSPCGKKLRTYPELNHYIIKNNIEGIELQHFSFSTKLRVGDFLEAKQGSKFEVLNEEQVNERFDHMNKRSRLSQERAQEKKNKKEELAVKARLAQEELQRKKAEMQALKKQKEEERRKAIQDKAKEAKLRKEQEREAAREAKHLREMAIMSKKLEKKNALEAERLAKRERVQNLIEEKRRAKEFKEKERLMKLENQRLKKEWKQQALENERERKRQMMVMSKAQEKEKRRREIVMMKAYEAQRRAEEKERLKEQKKLEKTLVRQRKLEQKRYEKLISRELKKPIDDMALKDMKPLPEIPLVPNLNIPAQAYADLLMVQEFIYSFGHVMDIDPEEDFPSMAELQASLLCESLSDDALYNACQSLLFYALHDPGVTGKYATTQLGANLQNVELNETNISEVLRLFILARNEGESHLLSDLLQDKPLVSLSPNNKAGVLAFLCNDLLCGKSIGREIEANLEKMSNLRRDKWTLEGEIRKLKADISKKTPKTSEGNETQGDEDKDSNDENNSDDEANNTFTGSQGFSESQEENDEDGDTSNLEKGSDEEMQKKLKLMEKRHSRYRKKLFDASHTIRGIHLGQDRYKRRYFILPNGGGIYVEGLESGFYDEDICTKTEEQKEKKKEHIGTLLTSIKGSKSTDNSPVHPHHSDRSPTSSSHSGLMTTNSSQGKSSLFSPMDERSRDARKSGDDIKAEPMSPNNSRVLSPSYNMSNSSYASFTSDTSNKKGSANRLSSSFTSDIDRVPISSPNHIPLTHTTSHRNIFTPTKKSTTKWFSLFSKMKCEDVKPVVMLPQQYTSKRNIVAPDVKLLSQDQHFLESSYNPSCFKPNMPNMPYDFASPGLLQPNMSTMHSTPKQVSNSTSLLGLPPGLDINLLIKQDPQKAAELLEIQLSVPQEVPKEMQHGWWRITDPEQLQRINKVAHPRGMRERLLQKSATRNMDYAVTSCKIDNQSFSLVLPNEDGEKGEIKPSIQKTSLPIVDNWFPQLAYASDKAILIEVEELEEKVFSASLQVKGYRLSQKISPTLHLDISKGYNPKGDEHPINAARSRLLALEAGVERRYLKHPFRLEKMGGGTSAEAAKDEALMNANIQEITPALQLWREAVSKARSSAQLSMCINLLNESIAWEKSIMKVFCILCRKSDNEERLLLCDMCDRGCHTYCCKPRLDEIPEGDWFCQECILMASGSDQCYACKGKSGKRLKCAFCPRHYHMQCLDPPLQKAPRSPWACPVCKKSRAKTKAPPTRKKPRVEDLIKEEESNKAKSNNRQHLHEHLEPCRKILVELENHEFGWPFLVPVNSKQFPEYYKIIKHSMDFHTMKTKLRDYVYKTREEFASDARLVFTNCNIFNEDESEVGRAGKIMRNFFETRWAGVLAELKKPAEAKTLEKMVETKPNRKEELNQSIIEKRESSSSDEEDDDSSSSDEISSYSESSEVEDGSDGLEEEHEH